MYFTAPCPKDLSQNDLCQCTVERERDNQSFCPPTGDDIHVHMAMLDELLYIDQQYTCTCTCTVLYPHWSAQSPLSLLLPPLGADFTTLAERKSAEMLHFKLSSTTTLLILGRTMHVHMYTHMYFDSMLLRLQLNQSFEGCTAEPRLYIHLGH